LKKINNLLKTSSRWRRSLLIAHGCPNKKSITSTRVEIAHLGIDLELFEIRVIGASQSCKVLPSSLNNGVGLPRASATRGLDEPLTRTSSSTT
jgi:hypothetical protein